jgi:hypothetical protein
VEGSQCKIGSLIMNGNLTVAPLCSGSTQRPLTHLNYNKVPSAVAISADHLLEMMH